MPGAGSPFRGFVSPFARSTGDVSLLTRVIRAVGATPSLFIDFREDTLAVVIAGVPEANPLAWLTSRYTGDGIDLDADGIGIFSAGSGTRTLRDTLRVTAADIGVTITPPHWTLARGQHPSGSGRAMAHVGAATYSNATRTQIGRWVSGTSASVVGGNGGTGPSATVAAVPAYNTVFGYRRLGTEMRMSANGSAVTSNASIVADAATPTVLDIGTAGYANGEVNGRIAWIAFGVTAVTDAQLVAGARITG